VDARDAAIRPMDAVLVDGLRVQVRGEMANGVLVAERVQVRGSGTGNSGRDGSASGDGSGNSNGSGNGTNGDGGGSNVNGSGNGNGNGNGNEASVYRINGRIARVDASQGTFVIRKTLVDHRNAEFRSGAAADLAAGQVVRVEGPLSADGTRLLATVVEFR
jgi:hypothetical protein